MNSLSRRQFLKQGLVTSAGVLLFPELVANALASPLVNPKAIREKLIDDPHFLFMITLPNPAGVDASYLWDARPLEMTTKGLIQNYRKNIAPTVWMGANNVSTLATDIVQPMTPFKSDFSIINGVLMSTGFDGHEQNINYLFTGDPFGGENFIPHLNQVGQGHKALDAIQKGKFAVTQTNGDEMVPLNPSAAGSLISALTKIPPINPFSKINQYIASRFAANATGMGGFSTGSRLMNDSFNATFSLSDIISQIKTNGDDSDSGFIELAGQFFRSGITRSALLVLDLGENVFDTHSAYNAANQPTLYASLMNTLATIFSKLKSTSYDGTRSLFDVTTVMFSSEFGRTMKQKGLAIDKTGTDHNPLTNCILLGGKGIKGGQVFGSTDFASATEVLSGAHLSLDPDKLKIMGRPFDFAKNISRADSPATYKASDYLGFNSVVNTLYSIFGVPERQWRKIERNGLAAPVLSGIIS